MSALVKRAGRITVALWLPMLVVGCGGQESLEAIVLRCSDLPGAKASELDALRSEVLTIEEAGQTPRLLSPQMPNEETNAAAILADSLSDTTRHRLFPRLAELMPNERFFFGRGEIEVIRRLVRDKVLFREVLDRADAAPDCVFAVRNELGYFADMRFLDDAAIASRMHLLTAAPAIDDGDMPTACAEIDRALRWVDRLAGVGRIEARLQAAQLRGEALSAIEALADHPAIQRPDLEKLYVLLRRSLDAWPSDVAALVGDRAGAMHSYEAIREGLFDEVITEEEQTLLEGRGLLASVRAMTPTLIDEDELAYLQAMARLIAIADKPFHARVETIEETLAPFAPENPKSVDTPLATHLFFPGLMLSMEEMARDRTICEAWALALAAASDVDLPPYKLSPITGAAYEIARENGSLRVRTGDVELREPYSRILPRRPKAEPATAKTAAKP